MNRRQSSVGFRGELAKREEIVLWVLVTLFIGVVALMIMWGVDKWNPIRDAPDWVPSIWEVFSAVFGLMYAIIVGLFLVESHRRLGELSSIIHSEINAIGDIHDCLDYFDDREKNLRTKEKIINLLSRYVEIVLKNDWKYMKDPRKGRLGYDWECMKEPGQDLEEDEEVGPPQKARFKPAFRKIRDTSVNWLETSSVRPAFRQVRSTSGNWWATSVRQYRNELFKDKGIRPLIKYVGELESNGDEISRHALGVIIDRISEVTTHRVNRLEVAQHKLAPTLYGLIIFMSLVIFGATLLLPLGWNLVLHGFIVFSTTIALVVLFLLLLDLDHPFTGLFGIREEILDDIRDKLDRKEGKGI